MPINENTLVYGSKNAGKQVFNNNNFDQSLEIIVNSFSDHFNLLPHNVVQTDPKTIKTIKVNIKNNF